MLESKIEAKMVAALTRRGAMAIKQEGTLAGLPDRLVVLPCGRYIWVELKQDKGRTRPVQDAMHARLRALGCDVRVIHGMQEAMDFVEEEMPLELYPE